MREQHNRTHAWRNGGREAGRPGGVVRMIPVGLFDALKFGEGLFPRGLKMPGTGPVDAGQDEDREIVGVAHAISRKNTQPASRPARQSRAISRAAFMPGTPDTPPPGCVPAPHM